ncbi:MAG: site-2 protease family protein [Gammaproteobacteria bacterium]|nr:site-2 protease family protein [Gammaproteobacteria bacterium]
MHLSIAIIAVLLSILLIVAVHEAGHAIVARCFGVRIRRIAVGVGKPSWRWRDQQDREWIVGLWPIGGYVHFFNTRVASVAPQQQSHCFDKKPIGTRILILVAGAAANVLLAWFALTGYYLVGHQQSTPIIATVTPASIAAQAQLKPGDEFISIAGHPSPSWQSVSMQLFLQLGKAQTQVIVKNTAGINRKTTLHLSHWQDQHQASLLENLGLMPDSNPNHLRQIAGEPLFQAVYHATTKGIILGYFYLMVLKQVLSGTVPFLLLLGPLGLLMTMVDSFLQGVAVFLYFLANLNLAVAIVNLLPLPGLDGGAIVYACIEKIRGKPLSIALEVLLHRLAMIALCVLFIQLIMNDVQRYFT